MKAYLEIEMPTSCCECAIKSWDGEDDVCPFSGISALSIGRQDDCPLFPVPPHGDLIDRDDAVEKIWDDMRFPSNLANAQFFVNELREMPTIIPAEE